MRIASFFSGIGGLELGLEWADLGHTVFQCEKDEYAQGVLTKHWPDVERHDDITQLKPEDIPQADIWCGGFPCQDISVAGSQAGIIKGKRSGLWWEWYDLIRQVGPRYLVIENVPGSIRRWLPHLLGSLADIGYDAEWYRVGACDVGAPHRRWRIFIIAWLADPGRKSSGAEGFGSSGKPIHGKAEGERTEARDGSPNRCEVVADADSDRTVREQSEDREGGGSLKGSKGGRGNVWLSEPHVCRVAHGIPSRVDRLRGLGNAVVPQCAYTVGLRLKEIRDNCP